ncbi:MAG: alpha/beta hydrolase [Gammaproteobacteria bacterium]|nr:alpha/beta hydrolase [Gammaproteobacteria bacterium]
MIRYVLAGTVLLLLPLAAGRAAETPAPPTSQHAVTPDVVYGHKAGMALFYDVFRPGEANGAAVAFMMSGGWFSRWRPPAQRVAWFEHLLDAGFTVFAVHHGSAPRFKVPEAVDDVRRAVRHIRMHAAEYGIDPERIGVHGGSAGGHLSLMLGLAGDAGDADAEDPVERVSSRVQAVVALFPPVDLTRIVGPSERFPALDFDPALAADVSPIGFASADDPPVLLIHGDEDELVPLANSEGMSAALDEVGLANEVIVIEGAGHGFRGADQLRSREETVRFFRRHLVGSPGNE